MLGVDLNSRKWCDMVFEGKDRQYGGYKIRRSIAQRTFVAYLIVIVVVGVLIYLPHFFAKPPQSIASQPVYDEVVVDITPIDELEQEVESDELEYIKMTPPPQLRSSVKFTVPVITDELDVEEDIMTHEELLSSSLAVSIEDIAGSDAEGAVDIADFQELVADEDVIYEEVAHYEVDQLPQFPGGEVALMQYLGDNIKYPQSAAKKKIHGQVVLRFVITETGEVGEVQVLRSSNNMLCEAAKSAVMGMPRWVPGKKNGEPVAMWFTMPINFALRNFLEE